MNRVEFVIEYTGFASAPHTGRGIGSPASSHEHHLSNSPHLQRGNSYPGTLLTPPTLFLAGSSYSASRKDLVRNA